MNSDLQFTIFVATTVAKFLIELLILLVLWRRADLLKMLLVMIGSFISKTFAGAWSPVVIDGILWVSIALFGFMQAYLSSEEAYKYVHPTVLFWMKFSIGSIAAAAGALKAFRSTTYSDARREKQDKQGLPPAATPVKVQPEQKAPDTGP